MNNQIELNEDTGIQVDLPIGMVTVYPSDIFINGISLLEIARREINIREEGN